MAWAHNSGSHLNFLLDFRVSTIQRIVWSTPTGVDYGLQDCDLICSLESNAGFRPVSTTADTVGEAVLSVMIRVIGRSASMGSPWLILKLFVLCG